MPGKPVILTDITGDWPARRLWTLDYFRQQHGHLQVTVRREHRQRSQEKTLKLADYIDYLEGPSQPDPFYLASWDFRTQAPELVQDFQLPDCWNDDWFTQVPEALRPRLLWLFIGPPGGGFRMHVDVGHTAAWNVQLYGRKSWLLYDPEQTQRLYEGQVDGFAPDLRRFPAFARAQAWECQLGPGEGLFIPSGWWHQTRIDETSVAVSGNYVNASNWPWVDAWLTGQGMLELHQELSKIATLQGSPEG